VFDHGSFCDASRLAKVSFVLALSRLSTLLRQSQSLLYSLDRCSMLTRLRKFSSPPICRERRLTGRIADISAKIGRTGAEKSAECRYGQICLKSARQVKKARRSNGLQVYLLLGTSSPFSWTDRYPETFIEVDLSEEKFSSGVKT